MSTTFANTIDSNPIYAQRAEQDKDGNRIDTTYAKSSSLATVATSGSYDDLSNKPTIPAAQVQSDYAQTDSSAVDYIKNKPTLFSGNYNDLTNKPDLSIYAESSNLASVATSGSYNDLSNKPTIPAAQVNADWNSSSGVSEILNKPNLATVATTGSYNDLSNTPTIPDGVPAVTSSDNGKVLKATYSGGTGSYSWETESGGGGGGTQVQSNWTESDTTAVSYIQNKPNLATVATSGSYNDLTNTPTIPAAQVNADWNSSSGVSEILNKPNLATVATSGSYNDLSNKPTIPDGVPTVTSNDDGKVLTAVYSGGAGSYGWATASGGGGSSPTYDSDWTSVTITGSGTTHHYDIDNTNTNNFFLRNISGSYPSHTCRISLSDNALNSDGIIKIPSVQNRNGVTIYLLDKNLNSIFTTSKLYFLYTTKNIQTGSNNSYPSSWSPTTHMSIPQVGNSYTTQTFSTGTTTAFNGYMDIFVYKKGIVFEIISTSFLT